MKSTTLFHSFAGPKTLGVTMEGTGSGSAYLYNSKVYLTLSSAQAAKYVEIDDQIFGGTRVVDWYMIAGDTTSATAKIQKYDGSSATDISNATNKGTTDQAIVRGGQLVDAAFDIGNDDKLRVTIATGAFIGIVVIELAPTP